MVGQVKSDFMPEDLGNPLSELGVLTKREHGPEPDQWDGYPVERRRLLETLKQHAPRKSLHVEKEVIARNPHSRIRAPSTAFLRVRYLVLTTSVCGELVLVRTRTSRPRLVRATL